MIPLSQEKRLDSSSDMLISPRTRGRHNADYGLRALYAYYRSHEANPVSYAVYSRVCKRFNQEYIMNEVILQGKDFYLPHRLGSLGVRKYKCVPYLNQRNELIKDHLPVDYKATKELWRRNPEARKNKVLIRLLNEHTNGYRMRFYWDKTTVNIVNQSAYAFIATRTASRRLGKLIKDANIHINFYEEAR